jgi:hypothetical protein
MGIPDVHSLAREMTWAQLQGWMAYAELEPFGEQRADLRMSILASMIYNANRGPKQKAKSPSDFMPQFGPAVTKPKRPLTDPAQWNAFAGTIMDNYGDRPNKTEKERPPRPLNMSARRRRELEEKGVVLPATV